MAKTHSSPVKAAHPIASLGVLSKVSPFFASLAAPDEQQCIRIIDMICLATCTLQSAYVIAAQLLYTSQLVPFHLPDSQPCGRPAVKYRCHSYVSLSTAGTVTGEHLQWASHRCCCHWTWLLAL